MQVAVAGEVQAEAAVGSDLIEHVVEVADAGVDVAEARFVQPYFGADVGFACFALNDGVARRAPGGIAGEVFVQEFFGDVRPVHVAAVVVDATDAEVVREFEVGFAVADGVAVRRIEALGGDVVGEQAGLRFAAGAAVFGAVRADVDGGEVDALAGEDVEQFLLGFVEVGAGEALRAEAVLVADHDEAVVFL